MLTEADDQDDAERALDRRAMLAIEETRFNSAVLALRADRRSLQSTAREFSRAESAMRTIEVLVARLPERDVWQTKVLALAAILERERAAFQQLTKEHEDRDLASASRDPVTQKLARHESMIDRALNQVAQARGNASDTAALLAENREKIESANLRTVAFIDEVDGARSVVLRMKARNSRQCWLVTALVVFLLGTVAAVAVILARKI